MGDGESRQPPVPGGGIQIDDPNSFKQPDSVQHEQRMAVPVSQNSEQQQQQQQEQQQQEERMEGAAPVPGNAQDLNVAPADSKLNPEPVGNVGVEPNQQQGVPNPQ